MRSFFPFSHGTREGLNLPIFRLCRIYCVMAAGAALFGVICVYLNSWFLKKISYAQAELFRKELSSALYPDRFSLLFNWLSLAMIVGAVFYGFKIAKQASVDACNNMRLLQEARQRTLEIAALYDISQDVSTGHELSALLKTILEKAKTLVNAAGCAIFLYDAEHDDFEIAVEVGVGMPIGTHLSRHEGLAGRVAETMEPLLENDYQNSPYRSKSLKQLPITAAVCVPMVRGGALVGVLGVHEVGRNNRKFTDAEARLLSLFADNAAGAVHHAQLLDALRNSEERFRIAAGCASDVVYDWNLVADHVDYFGAISDRMQASAAPLARTRQEYRDLIHPEDRARVQEALDSHFKTGTPFSEEYRILNEKGSYISVADRATAIRNKNGKPVRLIGAISDITERKHAEQMKSDFVSFVTHQLRTPLSGIKWMLELAMDSKEIPEEMESFIEDARIATDRLVGLVNDLLDISRLEQGGFQVARQNIDLAGLTREVVDAMTPLLLEKKQALSVQSAESLPQPSADPQLVRQAILNLISNASKYTPAGGGIQIRISRENDRVRWSVMDTGIGIPRADMAKLFGKFYRAENALVVATEGTGLGLYLVRLIVERFGGSVRCESEEGVGSTFLFELPLVA